MVSKTINGLYRWIRGADDKYIPSYRYLQVKDIQVNNLF